MAHYVIVIKLANVCSAGDSRTHMQIVTRREKKKFEYGQ